ncbi:MAG: hypothetical protein N2517_07850 [Ignavibacteria bacterium]|nr:hypothetical protein [Ignavibacteria bacterium]
MRRALFLLVLFLFLHTSTEFSFAQTKVKHIRERNRSCGDIGFCRAKAFPETCPYSYFKTNDNCWKINVSDPNFSFEESNLRQIRLRIREFEDKDSNGLCDHRQSRIMNKNLRKRDSNK